MTVWTTKVTREDHNCEHVYPPIRQIHHCHPPCYTRKRAVGPDSPVAFGGADKDQQRQDQDLPPVLTEKYDRRCSLWGCTATHIWATDISKCYRSQRESSGARTLLASRTKCQGLRCPRAISLPPRLIICHWCQHQYDSSNMHNAESI